MRITAAAATAAYGATVRHPPTREKVSRMDFHAGLSRLPSGEKKREKESRNEFLVPRFFVSDGFGMLYRATRTKVPVKFTLAQRLSPLW